MGKRYCFYCRDCDLKLTLFEDVCKNSKNKVCKIYCSNCEEIIFQGKCRECGEESKKIISIPKTIELKTEETETIECPKCTSFKTVITFLGEWD